MSTTTQLAKTTMPEPVAFQVAGMTCEHCARAVSAEIHQIAAVTAVTVDLATGQVIVTSSRPIDPAEVAAAVDEAGYRLG